MQNHAKDSFRSKIHIMILTADSDDDAAFWQQVLKGVEDSWREDERYIANLEARIAELESEKHHADAEYYSRYLEQWNEELT